MASRAVLRALRLREARNAPAAFTRRGGEGLLSAPASRRALVRSMANAAAAAPAAPCSGCEMQLLELRKEMLTERQRIWRSYEGMLEIHHLMLEKLCAIQSDAAKLEVVAVETMVNTSYRILSTGGACMVGMFLAMSPLLQMAWQEDTIHAMELRMEKQGLERIGDKGAKDSLCDQVRVAEGMGSGDVAAGAGMK